MYELFFKSFRQKVPLSAEEETQLKRYLTPKKLRKKQYLLQEGDVCKAIAFIEKGALKAYSVDEKGNEHIIQFGLEGWIISDLYSFLTGELATYNIDAIEDSEVLLISKSAHEELLLEMPAYETFTRLNITGAYLAMQKRLTSIISTPLKEQYTDFIALYPDIVQRVPQHMIASYLGLKPETLSRVRQKIAQK
ncbi:Crp/Fnr family transcriptional regulator [Pelobium manganitolerans]|uniref:Crp/Fnr family transcriptional regulator n=1 Tax=Pelobium manganitolerans TaxID=1842495 RepID=UPI003FA35865